MNNITYGLDYDDIIDSSGTITITTDTCDSTFTLDNLADTITLDSIYANDPTIKVGDTSFKEEDLKDFEEDVLAGKKPAEAPEETKEENKEDENI